MKKILTILVILGLASVASAGCNLVTNGDFELGDAGWFNWNWWNVGIGDHTADYGENPPVNMDAGIWWPDAGWVQVIGFLPEGQYQFGGQAINASAWPLSGRKAVIKAEMGDGTWTWWSQETSVDDTAPTNVWTDATGDNILTIGPGGVPEVKIVLLTWGMDGQQYSGSGNGYFDNIFLTEVFETLEVLVDIKPEGCPNPLVVKGKGVLTAAILGSCTLDVTDIEVASVTLGGATAIRSKSQDVGGPAAVVLDDMDDIAARPWTDDRDPGEGTGLLSQGAGTLCIDYGVTNDSAGVPHPDSGWDYLGNFVGVGAAGGAWGDPAICNYWWADWCNSYYGKFDRVPTATFTFAELGILGTGDTFLFDVDKAIANSPEHVRELQLYDSLGNRNTYSVQAEATAVDVGAGVKTYAVCLSNALENNADLTDITDIKFWVSSWSFAPNYPGAPWPEYTGGRPTGSKVCIDNLRLVRAHSPACGDCLTGADGFDDLVLKFNRADIVAGLGSVTHGDVVDLDLTGNLNSCQPIEGVDCVDIVGKADPAQRPPKK